MSIVPKEMRLLEQTFTMELRIQNPSDADLDINGMAFELEINGQPFAKGVSNQSVKVERLSTKVVQVEAYTGFISILRQLSEARKGRLRLGIQVPAERISICRVSLHPDPLRREGEFK